MICYFTDIPDEESLNTPPELIEQLRSHSLKAFALVSDETIEDGHPSRHIIAIALCLEKSLKYLQKIVVAQENVLELTQAVENTCCVCSVSDGRRLWDML